jgi:nucleoid-associated protein YgaU
MIDPVQAFLQANALTTPAFPPTSRYHGLPLSTLTLPDGTTVAYVQRRFVPPPDRFVVLVEHRVQSGDRLDNLAARFLGDPQQYWRLCDANRALRPDALIETPGRTLLVTLPEGVPGTTEPG